MGKPFNCTPMKLPEPAGSITSKVNPNIVAACEKSSASKPLNLSELTSGNPARKAKIGKK